MRKRLIVSATAIAVAGLAALGTVMAQPPGTGIYPATTVRPVSEWAPPTPQPASKTGTATRPSSGVYTGPPVSGKTNVVYPPPGGTPANRPRLSSPGVAGANAPVRPAGAFDVPPPNMEFPPVGKGTPVVPQSTEANKLPAPPAFAPLPPPSGIAPPPLPPTPALPSTPALPPTPVLPVAPALPPSAPTELPPFPTTPSVPSAPPTPSVEDKPQLPELPLGSPAQPAVATGMPSRVMQSVTVEAICPESVVYEAEFRYELVVRNAGNVAVQNVRIEDEIPAGVRYVGSDPPGEMNGDKLVWAIGMMDSNSEKRIAIRVRPTEEGELRSRATVAYTASVDAKTKVTRPRVAVNVSAPESARSGEEPMFEIKVTNSGTGPAQKMVLQAMLSDGLGYGNHGTKLETKLANLAAGESRTVKLPLSAMKAGLQSCQVTVTAEGSPEATAKATVNVVEPLLQITQTGPGKCLVRAEPTYEITLSNPGTAPTDGIMVHAIVPDGFDHVQASDAGTFNQATRTVSWKLPGLPVGGTKAVGIKLRAAAAGDVMLKTVAVAGMEQPGALAPAGGVALRAGRVQEARCETAIKAEGVAALRFDVAGLENPVEVGKEAIYEIRIVNQGTGACTNVQIMAALADGTTFTNSNGPTQAKATGQTLVFEPITTLAVKGETVYRVRVRGAAAGDQRFRVQLTCDQVRTPVVKEESTRFYKE